MRFRGSIPSPYLPLSTLVASSHEETATTWGTAWFATPFTVRDFHPLLLAGFYRRFGQSHLMRPAQRVFVRQVGCDPCLRHPCASRGPEAYWIPAYAGKTLKNAVPSCADRPAGFLCDPCLRHPFHEKVMSSKATWRLTVLELFAVLPSALFVGLCARCYLGSDEGGTASCEPVSA